MLDAPHTVADVFRDILRHPADHFIHRWNWKSALTSALIRACIFFSTNISAGLRAAVGAMLAEFALRSATSGFYGSVVQVFRRAEPVWAATLVILILIPLCSHTLEFCVHWSRGTPNLARSITASLVFTTISSLFNLYAMRQGVLVVEPGAEKNSIWSDMKAMPRVLAGFVALAPVALWRAMKGADRS